ncbi:hypothetical protein HXW87_02580 [Pseudomonas sp. Y5-11]|jgi:hypothetical protein|uniref:hypothetical protein n=1 Tax=Pseudomonas TaxID=286 RepID=UPI00103F6F73|nr:MULTISPECIES: hypothetical protein [Pseudomonas]QXE12540.1 hypothetical protein GTQ41_26965 [Pseudomonas sp. AN-B15]QXE12568.1 hypothetical protein GTQ41_27185 [Pseudomonas sp. AN-B15]ULN81085.1 hypothetical protein HXW87_02580 [Pseudomonas sp. Y5-11]
MKFKRSRTTRASTEALITRIATDLAQLKELLDQPCHLSRVNKTGIELSPEKLESRLSVILENNAAVAHPCP